MTSLTFADLWVGFVRMQFMGVFILLSLISVRVLRPGDRHRFPAMVAAAAFFLIEFVAWADDAHGGLGSRAWSVVAILALNAALTWLLVGERTKNGVH